MRCSASFDHLHDPKDKGLLLAQCLDLRQRCCHLGAAPANFPFSLSQDVHQVRSLLPPTSSTALPIFKHCPILYYLVEDTCTHESTSWRQ